MHWRSRDEPCSPNVARRSASAFNVARRSASLLNVARRSASVFNVARRSASVFNVARRSASLSDRSLRSLPDHKTRIFIIRSDPGYRDPGFECHGAQFFTRLAGDQVWQPCRSSDGKQLSDAESFASGVLALPGEPSEREEERTRILNSNPPRAFRIRMEDAALGGIDGADSGANRSLAASSPPQMNSATSNYPTASQPNSDQSAPPLPSRLVVVTVEVFESAEQEMSDDTRVLCQLSQLVRVPPTTGIP
ncbi:MAG: hypothetical protein R3C09_09110 [Pirellulaceae bacterium]